MTALTRRTVVASLGVLAGCGKASTGQSQACAPTESDSLGPFYVSDTPIVDNLNRFGKSGEPMRLSGRIMSSGTQPTPINGARIEIWQTDGDGDYHPAGNGAYEDYADEDIDLRGTVISDENGAYSVMTLIPGAYFPRPRHFHYRITAPGYEPLVTQLYITGDGVVSQPGGDCRHAEIEESSDGSRYNAPDIFLVTS